MTAQSPPTVETQYGTVRGKSITETVDRFASIPYAASPVDDRRFKPPEPPTNWDSTRDATDFRSICPQEVDSPPREYISVDRMSEDCLTLNIWTPGTTGADRPVMMWIHGGGFIYGAGNDPRVDGTQFAQRGDVVLVTIQYRLGPLGGLYLAHRSDEYSQSHNNHILDQRQALRWLRENIGAFGGDPNNITVFGESAGSTSVTSLLVSRNIEELADKMIAQSGGLRRLRDPEKAKSITEEFFDTTGLADIDDLLALSTEALREHTSEFINENSDIKMNLFRPVRDGELIPRDPLQHIRDGNTADIPLMHGSNKHEFNWWTRRHPDAMSRMTFDEIRTRLQDHYPLSDEDIDAMIDAVSEANPTSSEAQRCFDIITQNRYREDHRLLAQAREGAGESWQYLFAWESPNPELKAPHTIEIPFVFHNLSGTDLIHELLGDNPPVALADQAQDTWIAFARRSDPNHDGLPEWPHYDTHEYPVLVFDSDSSLAHDPESIVRKTWEEIKLPTYSTPIPRF